MAHEKREVIEIYLIGIGLALFLISGCAGKTVRLSPDNYQPAFSATDFGSYKGKQLYLSVLRITTGMRVTLFIAVKTVAIPMTWRP